MKKPLVSLSLSFLIVIAGVASGFGLSKATGSKKGATITKTTEEIISEGLKAGDVIGNPDEETFTDPATGVLIKGGIEGEGSHRILRPGGVSQNVYLTSSVIDLDEVIDHKVRVWGETFAAQQAGWLMDVGRIEIIELNAEKPFEPESD